jgi:hypothetical protein
MMARSLIALDCDGTVQIANGPIPMDVVAKLYREHQVFIIGNKALAQLTGAPNAGFHKGLLCSGLEYPGGKSQALRDWAKLYPQFKIRMVIDDNPAQYLDGWEGWQFFSPQEFLDKVVPIL